MAFTKITAAGIGSTETVTLDGLSVINDGSFGGNVSIAGTLTYEDVTNVDAVGLITARDGIVVGSGITLSKDGDGFFTGIITATFAGDGSSLTGVANTNVIFTDKISLGDNERINIGIGSDLMFYHNGTESWIINETGTLNILNDGDTQIKNRSDNQFIAKFEQGGSCELYEANSKKFETDSNGITVTGTVTATAFSGDGSSLTGIGGTANVRTGILDVAGVSTFRNTMNVGAAVTISESGIEASGIGITVANINGGQVGGRRNLIINGAMMVAERGTSSTTGDNSFATLDRFRVTQNSLDEDVTQAQDDIASGTGPYNEGFRKSLKITNGNQTSGAEAADYIRIGYAIEAQDIANSGWNYTSSSSFITFQFWIKSSVAQSFKVEFYVDDGTAQVYSIDTGSLSADTWTKVIKTIPGNSNLTFDNNVNEGLHIRFLPFFGTNYTNNSVTEDAWAAYNSSTRTKDNTSTWFTTNNATFEITGIQLEVGSQATPFEHRSLGEELQLCKRYYQRHPGYGDHMMFGLARAESNTARAGISVPVPMRTQPTVSCNGSRTFQQGYISESTSTPSLYASSGWISSSALYTIDFGGHSLTHNNMYALMSKSTTKNALELDAEIT